jgi:hypothetical protein
MGQGQAASVVNAEEVAEAEGRRRIAAGEATALLFIPPGFSGAVLRGDPAVLRLVTNPSERILPGIVEEWLEVLVDAVFYAQRLLGDDLRAMAEGPPKGGSAMPDAWVADLSVRINRLVTSTADWLTPPVIALETTSAEDATRAPADSAAADPAGGARRSFALAFVPGLLLMALLFVAQNLAEDFWREREAGTLRRAAITPHGLPGALYGKTLFGTLLLGVISVAPLVAGWAYFGLAWPLLPVALAWCILSGLLLLSMMTLLMLLATTRRNAHMLGMAVTFPLMMLGGSFFPFHMMPAGMAAIGRLTPNGWALSRLLEIVLGQMRPGPLLASGAGIAALIAALLAISLRRLRTFAKG